jgi:para-nitrobenzyl esterase
MALSAGSWQAGGNCWRLAMKTRLFAVAIAAGLSMPVLVLPVRAQTPAAPAPAPAYSVATTTIGDLLDKPFLRAIFNKHLPEIVANPQVELGRPLTLPEIVQYAPDVVTPEKLAAIDAELKALPAQ